MSEFSRETLLNIIETDHVQCGEASALARMALVAMGSEPVAIIDQANLDYLRSGADADVWPPEREEMGDVLLYRHAQPAPVVLDERAAFNAWNNEDNLPIAGVGAKNAAWLAWQARAKLAGNSPVIPDGSASMLHRWLAFGRGMQNAGSQLPHNLIAETESMLAAATQETNS